MTQLGLVCNGKPVKISTKQLDHFTIAFQVDRSTAVRKINRFDYFTFGTKTVQEKIKDMCSAKLDKELATKCRWQIVLYERTQFGGNPYSDPHKYRRLKAWALP